MPTLSSDEDLHSEIHSPSHAHASSILASLNLAAVPPPEEIHREIEESLLLPKERLPAHWVPTYQIHWEEPLALPTLLPLAPAPAPTRVDFVRTGLEGRVTGYTEVPVPKASTGLTSTSLTRLPTTARTFVRGKSGNSPFLPGGLDDVVNSGSVEWKNSVGIGGKTDEHQALLTVAPGLSRGLRLPGEVDVDDESVEARSIIRHDHKKCFPRTVTSMTFSRYRSARYKHTIFTSYTAFQRTFLAPPTHSHPSRPKQSQNIQQRDWAHVVDITQPMPEYDLLKDGGGLAKEYPFPLDPFQKAAVTHLERGESVFVAAHTSAGKTVVAEYAIALAGRHVTRTIYTSPIKALSNQKFRDFKTTFGAATVGILTGDVQINPEAPCLIMTTEILRSMLYKGADLIRDVEWVVFDEVHYVSDAERGVVWEEVIIMLPEHVNVILLSATIPNTREFADWVGRTKKKDIYVISTPKRPVPLEHFLYAGRETYKIVDSKGDFLSQGYKDAGEALRRKQDKEREAAGMPPVVRLGTRGAANQRGGAQRGGAQRGGPNSQPGQRGAPSRGVYAPRGGSNTRSFHHQQDKSLYVHLLGHLRKKDLLPTVVFTFSKKRCEEQAGTLTNADLCTSVEKSEVHVALERALGRLSVSDRKLPQIGRMRELLSRGIGVHHGGLLPIVKEVVEILFARGLVKILFATETFAMGVNMPARCVVFSGIRKHDGHSFREILPGEYTQMSGRAGRRGLDATGVVVVVVGDELPDTPTLHKMMLGVPSRLQSQFRLTYNMILNLLRVEALRVEEMIKRSFSENASQRLLPDQQKKVAESEKTLVTLPKLSCERCWPTIEDFYSTSNEIVHHNQHILELVSSHPQGLKSLSSGRVVVLKDGHFPSNAGAWLKAAPFQISATGVSDHVKHYFVLVLVNPETKARTKDVNAQAVPPRWPPPPESLLVDDGTYELVTVPLASISLVSNRNIKVDVNAIVDQHRIAPMREAVAQINAVIREWVEAEQSLIPEVDWGRMRQLEFQETLRRRDSLAQGLLSKSCLLCPDFDSHYHILHGEMMLRANIAALKMAISNQNLELLPDYEQRIDVLKDLKFIDENATVLLKGRVACEINSAHELILTELILENTLAAFDPEEVVALISCFVFQEKTDIEPVIPPKIQGGRDAIQAIVEKVGAVQLKRGVGEDLAARIKFGLVEVVYEWAKGMPFEQITALTDVAEGTIVRVITRLDETCREIRDAARVIGDAELFKKMEEAQIKIKRDIVFAASLYF
ncbi:antiviral helicase [Gautieria morchelliformis]|nr:antiviral helicase [Gautieria morchelliformis]